MDQFSVGSRTDRREERLVRTMALAVSRGDRVSIHSLRDRINALRRENIANATVVWTDERGWHDGPRVRVALDHGRLVTMAAR